MITNSPVQSSTRTLFTIYAILFIDISTMLEIQKAHWLIGKPYLATITGTGLKEGCGFWMAQYEDEFPGWVRVSGHLQTLIQSIGHLWLKVRRCPTLSHQPICIKHKDENNNILGVDLWIKVRRCLKLALELETRLKFWSSRSLVYVMLRWTTLRH